MSLASASEASKVSNFHTLGYASPARGLPEESVKSVQLHAFLVRLPVQFRSHMALRDEFVLSSAIFA